MSGFDFDQTEKWDVSTSNILPSGNHVCECREADNSQPSSGGHPQIILKWANADGEITDWMVVTAASFGKVVALCEATGVQPTDEEKQYFKDNNGKAPDSFCQRLLGAKAGVVVRPEPAQDVTKPPRDRVKGYVQPSAIGGSDVTPVGASVGNSSSQPVADDEIPF